MPERYSTAPPLRSPMMRRTPPGSGTWSPRCRARSTRRLSRIPPQTRPRSWSSPISSLRPSRHPRLTKPALPWSSANSRHRKGSQCWCRQSQGSRRLFAPPPGLPARQKAATRYNSAWPWARPDQTSRETTTGGRTADSGSPAALASTPGKAPGPLALPIAAHRGEPTGIVASGPFARGWLARLLA